MPEDSVIDLMNECIAEDMEAVKEVVEEDILPLIKYRAKLEKDIYNKAYKEVKDLEEELP